MRKDLAMRNQRSFNNWRHRDLSLEEIIYLFLDGIYLGVRVTVVIRKLCW